MTAMVDLYQTQSGFQPSLRYTQKTVFAIHTQLKQLINLKNYQRTIKFGIKQTLFCVCRDA